MAAEIGVLSIAPFTTRCALPFCAIIAAPITIFPIGKMMIETCRQFGAAIAAARKTLEITQRDLALAINSGERFIVDLEAGKPTAQLGKALAAARAVGLRLALSSGSGK